MEVIAITEDGRKRIVLCGDIYLLQALILVCSFWIDKDETKQEWVASKWILDYGMNVSTDYPTIDEIKKAQSNDKKV